MGMALTSYFKSYQQLGLIEVFLLPIFLFSGSLFPTEILPSWANVLVKISPLWHAIELVRMLILGNLKIASIFHVLFLMIFSLISMFILSKRIIKIFFA